MGRNYCCRIVVLFFVLCDCRVKLYVSLENRLFSVLLY